MVKILSVLALSIAIPAAAAEPPPVAPTTPVGDSMTPTVAAAPTLTPAQIKANEIVCRSNLETGSLVKRHKECHTRKQWAYVNDQHENFARKMVEDNSQKFAIP